jgi:hypothetical protein
MVATPEALVFREIEDVSYVGIREVVGRPCVRVFRLGLHW